MPKWPVPPQLKQRAAAGLATGAFGQARIEDLVARRKALCLAKDYAAAAELKKELKALDVTVVDTDDHSWYVGKKKKKKEQAPKPVGLCFAFQKGECYRGDGCHFRHEWEGGEGEAAATAAAPAKSKAVTYGASLWE